MGCCSRHLVKRGRWARRGGALLVLAGLLSCAQAVSVREREIAQCRASDIATWRDGVDRPAVSPEMVFVYRHQGAPAWFSETVVRNALQRAAAAWSQCGVPGRVLDLSNESIERSDAILVQWNDAGSGGNFGLADLTRRRLSLGSAAFALLRERNPRYDARQSLQMVISHEMGHLFGLMAHSRRCIDVTSYYHDGKGQQCYAADPGLVKRTTEYRATLPTACDIQRCRRANGF